jgi:hypothetical protein
MKTNLLGGVSIIAGMALFGVPQASAMTDIVYDVTPLTFLYGASLTGGTITTDGTIGPLASSDILSWSFTFTFPGFTSFPLSPLTLTSSGLSLSFASTGSPLTATSTDLYFDFTSLSAAEPNFSDLPLAAYGIADSAALVCSTLQVGFCLNYPTANVLFYAAESSSAFILAAGGVPATPLPAALPLFAGGLGMMGLLGWRRKRKKAAAIAAA